MAVTTGPSGAAARQRVCHADNVLAEGALCSIGTDSCVHPDAGPFWLQGVAISGPPTKVVLVRNMVGPGQVDEDLEDEVSVRARFRVGAQVRVRLFLVGARQSSGKAA